MEEHLKAAGRSIILRHLTNRWLEYAIAAWIIGLLTLILDRWQGWNLTSVVASLVTLGCVCAGVASIHNLRYIDSTRRERVLTRQFHGGGSLSNRSHRN